MEKHKAQIKKWSIAIVLMLCIAFFNQVVLEFDIRMTWIITSICATLFIGLGEKLICCELGRAQKDFHLIWGIITVSVITVALYFIEKGSFEIDEGYWAWILSFFWKKNYLKCIEYEIGTQFLGYYVLFLILYGRTVWNVAKHKINEWIPNFWCVIVGIGLVFYIKGGLNQQTRLTLIIAVGVLLIAYQGMKYISNRDQEYSYHLSAKYYLMIYGSCLVLIVGMGLVMPECQELFGARWIRRVVNEFSGHSNLRGKIPFQKHLDDDIELSEAILFKVKSSQSLYLREMAYKDYEDGVWSVADEEETEDYFIFKPQYLQAEYSQIQSLLDELNYQNSQNKSILPKYAEIANHETSVIHKKQYTIEQNPINRINYFTVNGVVNIKDEGTTNIYYYRNINNCYFYNDNLTEPSNYTVEYYDHTPKMGSREYMFLQETNGELWESIYNQIEENRQLYGYNLDDYPKLLLSYTPLVQYRNAKRNFLQIPENLKRPLTKFTKQLIKEQRSDWASAETICNFLKEKYTYSLHRKISEDKDPILNFLILEKEGICQEFATSMVLMCRSVGIPAKYVTGYLVTEKDNDTGEYIVREKDAHAFVEAYIAGYGWMTFDPTPISNTEENIEEEAEGWSRREQLEVVGVIGFLIGLFIISRGGLLYVQEILWKVAILFKKPSIQLERLMKETCDKLERSGYKRERYETLSAYAKRLDKSDIEIKEMVQYYEAYKYGNEPMSKQQVKKAYEEYIRLKEKLKDK